ncbi:unnamed protein product [Orchesella dallaii]|uniref:EB domain-containing protein n=1 Tax=Orchesella dallaii TaxID=48710 RepID=A0ABP1S4F0_9HEXA
MSFSLTQAYQNFSFTYEEIFGQLLGRLRYGDQCNSSARAENQCQFGFGCYNESCQCHNPEVSTYHNGKCLIKAGERCMFKYFNYNSLTGSQVFLREEKCVENSICERGLCSCLPGFYKTGNGTCMNTRWFGAPCDSDLECDSELYMSCNASTKVCDCGSASGSGCGLRIYSPCSDDIADSRKCQKNSHCGEEDRCECDSDYFINFVQGDIMFRPVCQRRRFYSYFNETCETDDDCHGDDNNYALICNAERKCDCSGSRPVFSSRKRSVGGRGGVCVQVLGGGCWNDVDCDENENMECKAVERLRKCTCKDTYFETADGKCEPVAENK